MDWPFQMKSNQIIKSHWSAMQNNDSFINKIWLFPSFPMAHAGPPLLALFFFHVYFWMHGIATWQSTNLHRWLQHWRIMPVPWSVLIYRWNHLCLRCLRWKMHCTRRCCRLPWCHSFLFLFWKGRWGKWFWEETCGNRQLNGILVYLFLRNRNVAPPNFFT